MTMAAIIKEATHVFKVPARAILSGCRDVQCVEARFAVVHVTRDKLGYSFPRIGAALDRDHSTIQHAYRRAQEWEASKPGYSEKLIRVGDFKHTTICPCCKRKWRGQS